MERLGTLRRFDPVLGAIAILAFALRLAYALQPHVSFGDESCYVWLAQSLLRGEYTYYAGKPELHFPPLFPAVLAALHAFASWEAVTRVAYVLFGVLALAPAYALGRALYGPRAARLAGLLLAVAPAFTSTVLVGTTLSEPLYLFLLFAAFYLVHRASFRGGWASHLGAGACLSLAYLARPEGFLHFLGAGSYLAAALAARFVAKEPAGRARARAAAAGAAKIAGFAVAFLAVSSPYVDYLYRHTGQISLTTKSAKTYTTTRGLVVHDGEAFQRDTWGLDQEGEVRYYAHGEKEGLLALLTGRYRHRVLSDLRANTSSLIVLFEKPHFFGLIPLLFAFLGFFGTGWSRERLRAEVFNLWMAAPLGAALVYYVTERFFYAALLPSYFWVALGLEAFSRWLRGSEFPRPLRARRFLFAVEVAGLAGLIAAQLVFAQKHFARTTAGDAEVFAAAAWLERHTPADATVLAAGPEIAFHARRRWLPLPVGRIADVVRYAKERGGRYFCLRSRYANVRPEQKARLFDRPGDLPGIEFLAKLEGGRAPSLWAFVVYRLNP
ncbi:MAG: ArnT family glycosyltransferase [Planctomycetota bacterium]